MARRFKPTYLKVISGSRRPINHNQPEAAGNLSDTPAWLTDSQKEMWRYVIAHAPAGLLRALDRAVLEVWVVADDMHREAARKVAQHGMLIKAPNTGVPMQSPYLTIKNKQALIMLKAAAELGFSPVSRSSVSADRESSGNPFANNGRRP